MITIIATQNTPHEYPHFTTDSTTTTNGAKHRQDNVMTCRLIGVRTLDNLDIINDNFLWFQIDEVALQMAAENGDGEYLDLEASINEQAEEIQGLRKP